MSTEITLADDLNAVRRGERSIISSFKAESFDDREKLATVIANAEQLSDHLNKTLKIVHVIFESTEFTDSETGEMVTGTRAFLVDEKWTAYSAISEGLLNSLRRIIGIVGDPTEWPRPVNMTVVEKGPKGKQFYTINLG